MIPSRCFGMKFMSMLLLLLTELAVMFAVDQDCNYYQKMTAGVTYYVYNKEYPGYYGPNKNCLWVLEAPQGYVVDAICKLDMPNPNGCVDDRLLISRSGEPNLKNAEVFCGLGNKTLESNSNKLSIGLQSSYLSRGGRFLCSLQAKVPVPQCTCGWKNMRRIVGGEETEKNEFPMMAGLVDLKQKIIFCGSTIITNNHVLTAAHCFKGKDISIVAVLVGDHDISTGAETNATRLIPSKRFIIHPEYDDVRKKNDIAIVQTEYVIKFSWAVGPVCLPFFYYQESFTGQEVELIGWGTTQFTGPDSDVLLKTDVNIISNSACNNMNATKNQLCTFRKNHDACQKDSGGPVLWSDDSFRVFQLGIISYGRGCATDKPAVNTRVTSYLLWIMSVTPGAEYCNAGPKNF